MPLMFGDFQVRSVSETNSTLQPAHEQKPGSPAWREAALDPAPRGIGLGDSGKRDTKPMSQ